MARRAFLLIVSILISSSVLADEIIMGNSRPASVCEKISRKMPRSFPDPTVKIFEQNIFDLLASADRSSAGSRIAMIPMTAMVGRIKLKTKSSRMLELCDQYEASIGLTRTHILDEIIMELITWRWSEQETEHPLWKYFEGTISTFGSPDRNMLNDLSSIEKFLKSRQNKLVLSETN